MTAHARQAHINFIVPAGGGVYLPASEYTPTPIFHSAPYPAAGRQLFYVITNHFCRVPETRNAYELVACSCGVDSGRGDEGAIAPQMKNTGARNMSKSMSICLQKFRPPTKKIGLT